MAYITGSLPFLIAGASAVAISVPLAIATIILAVHTNRIRNKEANICSLFNVYVKNINNWENTSFVQDNTIKQAQKLLMELLAVSTILDDISNGALDISTTEFDRVGKRAHMALSALYNNVSNDDDFMKKNGRNTPILY